jgi:hypothetical protein
MGERILSPDNAKFLEDLLSALAWEWKLERRHRLWMWGVNWATWICRVILLSITTFQLTTFGKGIHPLVFMFSAATLSMFNVALPLVSTTFKFQQRQEVHDRTARAYDLLRTEFETNQIDLPTAMERYRAIYEQPTEVLLRKTP